MILRSLAVVAALLSASVAVQAADLIIPATPEPIMEQAGFSWDGLYAGVQGGGQFYEDPSYGVVGVHVGANFLVADPILIGVEATADWLFGDISDFGAFYANARLGALVSDDVLVYALAGTGFEVNADSDTIGTYQLGGGVEFAVTESVSLRGQVTGIGFYDEDDFLIGTKATVGASYHF